MSLLASWLASSPPDAAVEIAPERVSAATMSGRGTSLNVQSHATEALQAGAVVASLGAHNIHERAAGTAAVRWLLSRRSGRSSRVALIITDVLTKCSCMPI